MVSPEDPKVHLEVRLVCKSRNLDLQPVKEIHDSQWSHLLIYLMDSSPLPSYCHCFELRANAQLHSFLLSINFGPLRSSNFKNYARSDACHYTDQGSDREDLHP